jgi:hypothetical protein
VRSVRRRLCPTKNTMDPLAERDLEPIGRRIACGLGRAHVTAFAQDEPDEAGAILEAARRYPA